MRRPVLAIGWIVIALTEAAAQAAPTGGDDDLEISVTAKPAPATPEPAPATPVPAQTVQPAPVAPPSESPQSIELSRQVEALNQRISVLEKLATTPPPPPPPPPPVAVTKAAEQPAPPAFSETASPVPASRHGITLFEGLRISGYLQGQYQRYDQSENQLSPSGAPLNEDRFEIRRARVRLTGDWKYAGFMIEADGNTVNGPAVGLTRAEASLFLRNGNLALPPYLKATLGLTIIPFGLELQQPENELAFMERTTASTALFPNRQDIGLTLSGGAGPFLYQIGLMDGDDTGGFSVPPTAVPDLIGRIGVRNVTSGRIEVSGGLSFLTGQGFSAGTTATKDTLTWVDSNGNGVVDSGELIGVPGTPARPSTTFSHWGVNADFEIGVHTKLGWSRLYLEATMASNLDRGLFVADPVALGRSLRETAFLAALVQDLTEYGYIGFRIDSYDPDSDFLVSQRGQELVTSQTLTTLAPVVGLRLPGRARLSFEYDAVLNLLGRDSSGVPTQLQDNDWILRLQVEL